MGKEKAEGDARILRRISFFLGFKDVYRLFKLHLLCKESLAQAKVASRRTSRELGIICRYQNQTCFHFSSSCASIMVTCIAT